MKVGRITLVELKSQAAIDGVLSSNATAMTTVWKTAETSTVVRTGPASLFNFTVYPNSEAADSTLQARSKWFKSVKENIEDTFYYEGEVLMHMTGEGKNLLKNDPEKDALKVEVERLSGEISQLKNMVEQLLSK